jgi:hypothetical protein
MAQINKRMIFYQSKKMRFGHVQRGGGVTIWSG